MSDLSPNERIIKDYQDLAAYRLREIERLRSDLNKVEIKLDYAIQSLVVLSNSMESEGITKGGTHEVINYLRGTREEVKDSMRGTVAKAP